LARRSEANSLAPWEASWRHNVPGGANPPSESRWKRICECLTARESWVTVSSMFGAQYAGGAREGGPPLGSPRTLPRPLNLRFRPFRSTPYIYCQTVKCSNLSDSFPFSKFRFKIFIHFLYKFLQDLLYIHFNWIDIRKNLFQNFFRIFLLNTTFFGFNLIWQISASSVGVWEWAHFETVRSLTSFLQNLFLEVFVQPIRKRNCQCCKALRIKLCIWWFGQDWSRRTVRAGWFVKMVCAWWFEQNDAYETTRTTRPRMFCFERFA
jgi:hypothetical protein